MRLFSKIFSIIFVLYVLSILFVPSVKADCYFDAYTHCVGTCSCPKAGTCTCKLDSTGHVCQADTTYCCSGTCRPNFCAGNESSSGHCDSSGQLICCVTNPPPQPTATPVDPGSASPTETPAVPKPTIGGALCPNPTYPKCSGSDYCTVTNCGQTIANCGNPQISPVSDCSSICNNGHCYTTHPGTNPTVTDVRCNTWGAWGSCLSGSSTCGGCPNQGYTCQVRFCADPSNSNQYQISCGCTQPSGPPGTGGSTCQNLYYCRLSDLLVPSTSSTYDPQSHLQCPNGDLCESNLKTYLPGQTTETCYNSPTYAQGYCCKPLYYCNTTTGCQQTSSSYDSSHRQCTATGGRLSNTCEANLQTYLPGQTAEQLPFSLCLRGFVVKKE